MHKQSDSSRFRSPRRGQSGSSGGERVLSVLIVIAAVILVFSAIYCVGSFHEVNKKGTVEETSIIYWLDSGNYSRMVREIGQARAEGQSMDGDLAEYAAVADYFEAASFYIVYDKNNRVSLAAQKSSEMQAAAARMGTLSGEKVKIDKKLGLAG